jgi:type II secretory pathway pseudopilin PulG
MTLIEILVAVSLMGLLAVAMVTALTVGAGSWQDARERLTLDRRIATANEIFYREFEGIVPLAALPAPGQQQAIPRAPFFQGEPESMRFVTNYSVAAGARGGLRVAELRVTPTPRGSRILLNEAPYRGPADLGRLILGVDRDPASGGPRLVFRPIEAQASSLIVADDLKEARFSYLRTPRTRMEAALWVPVWSDMTRLPGAIRVELAANSERPGLEPISITAPVRARYGTAGVAGGRPIIGGVRR